MIPNLSHPLMKEWQKRHVFILSGDHRQAKYWARENGLKLGKYSHPKLGWLMVRYLRDRWDLEGLEPGFFDLFGTFGERRDYRDLRAMLAARRFKQVTEDDISSFRGFLGDPDTVLVERAI